MPGFLLHAGAKVLCGHGGQASPAAPGARVLVDRQPVTTQPAPYLVAACPQQPPVGPPCLTAQWTSAAQRVFASGQPLLLNTSSASTAPNAAPLSVVQCQARVRGA